MSRACYPAVLPAALIAALVAVPFVPTMAAEPAAQWAIDPTEPGAHRLPAGRSVFEELTDGRPQYPLGALLRQIEQRVGCKPGACVEAVLIPLGRSLQRTAAAPDYFASPRIVLAVTGEGRGPVFARHRLYLGFQPRTSLLEVISYNDVAGRFEFELVRDYRAGGDPRLAHADRSVCIACHQNHAPIFSRPLWQETNANPEIARRLIDAAEVVALTRGVDVPRAIDDATDHANLLGVTQRLWRDACDADCRRDAMRAAFEYRVSGGIRFDAVPGFPTQFARAWPEGLALPNPDLPNRDPLAGGLLQSANAPIAVGAAFEALQPRPALEVWRAEDPWLERRFVIGLAAYLADADLSAANRDLAGSRQHLAAQSWPGESVGRAAFRAALGLASDGACCAPSPAAVVQRASSSATSVSVDVPPRARAFVAHCGACHATAERAPPNFLAGDAQRIEASLAHCAPRMFVRLAMWQRPAAQRGKVPMPPPRAAHAGRPSVQAQADAGIADLQRTVSAWLATELGHAPDVDELLARGYDTLRPCLPAGA